jgi:putative membrane protein
MLRLYLTFQKLGGVLSNVRDLNKGTPVVYRTFKGVGMKYLFAVLLTLVARQSIASSFEPGYFGYGHMGGFMGLGGFLFWFIVLALIIYAIKNLSGHRSSYHSDETALDIAKKRYARGEISKEELDEIKENL